MRRFSFGLFLAAMVLGGLVGCRQPPLAVLTGPTLVVLSDELPESAVVPVPFRADSALAGTPPLFLYVHPSLDTAGVPWLRRLSHLPTAPWQVEFAQHGRLRGQAIHYEREERFWPQPYQPVASPPFGWYGYYVSLTYPELPAGVGPPGSNDKLREQCYEEKEELLYLWVAPQPAYAKLPLAQRRRLTDTVLLHRSWPAHIGLLRLADGREILSLTTGKQTCDHPRPAYSTTSYTSWGGYDLGRASYTAPETIFQDKLYWLLGQAVLTLVRDTREQHHLPPLTAAQIKDFYAQFYPYEFVSFTPHGLLLHYNPAAPVFRGGKPLEELLPPDTAPEFHLLLPYQVVAPYTRPPR
jgi:hypothetical protein